MRITERAFDCGIQRGYDFSGKIIAQPIDSATVEKIVARLKDKLGSDFDVVLEEDHIHIEFQPKAGINL